MIVDILIAGTGIFLYFLLMYCILRTSARIAEFMIKKRVISEDAKLLASTGLVIGLMYTLILFILCFLEVLK